MYYYINSFYIYGFLGFIYENLLYLITKHTFVHNILLEPVKPIYGLGAIMSLVLERTIFNNLSIKRRYKIILYFIATFIILTIFEYLSGVLLYKIFHKYYWDYSDKMFHIGKYICLEVSVLWSILSIVYLYFLKPRLDKIIKKIPVWFSNFMLVITISDILLSLIF